MFKILIITFILGVFVHGAVGDINCFLKGQNESLREIQTNFKEKSVCRHIKLYWERTRNDTKTCSMKKIVVTKAEAFTKDLCTLGWELNERFQEKEECFTEQYGKQDGNCLIQLSDKVRAKTENETELRNIGKAICTELVTEIYTCLNTQLGKPCGDDAERLIKEMTDAVSPYTKVLCEEIGGASTMAALPWTILLAILLLTMWHKNE